MADGDEGRDQPRSRGMRDSDRYFVLPSEAAEQLRREERTPDTTKRTSGDTTGRGD